MSGIVAAVHGRSEGPLRSGRRRACSRLRGCPADYNVAAAPSIPRCLNGKYLRNARFQPDRIYSNKNSNKIRFPNLPLFENESLLKNKSYMKEPERSEHVSDFAREKSKNKADIRILHAHTDHSNKLNGIISIYSKIQIFHQGALNHHESIQIFYLTACYDSYVIFGRYLNNESADCSKSRHSTCGRISISSKTSFLLEFNVQAGTQF